MAWANCEEEERALYAQTQRTGLSKENLWGGSDLMETNPRNWPTGTGVVDGCEMSARIGHRVTILTHEINR